jgi:hypothetical protein
MLNNMESLYIVPVTVFFGVLRSYVQRIVVTFSFFVLRSYVQRTVYILLLLLTSYVCRDNISKWN